MAPLTQTTTRGAEPNGIQYVAFARDWAAMIRALRCALVYIRLLGTAPIGGVSSAHLSRSPTYCVACGVSQGGRERERETNSLRASSRHSIVSTVEKRRARNDNAMLPVFV